MINRRALFATLGAAMLAARAAAQQQHWLIGTWKGDIGGGWNGKEGSGRTMVVAGVDPAGAVSGGWAALGKPRVGNADITLAGEKLTVRTGADSMIEMRRGADGKLTGMMRIMKSGKTYPIEMKRE